MSNYKWGGVLLLLLSGKKKKVILLLFPYIGRARLHRTYLPSQPVTVSLTEVIDNRRQTTFSKRSKRNLLQA